MKCSQSSTTCLLCCSIIATATPLCLAAPGAEMAAKLLASDGQLGDGLGMAVGISGDTVVVGAARANNFSGEAYIFQRLDGTWAQIKKLVPLAVPNGGFCSAIAIWEDTLAVGNSSSNDVFLYGRNIGGPQGWGLIKRVRPISDSPSNPSDFGRSLALNQDTLLVGALGDMDAAGAAFVFCRNNGGNNAWGQVAKLTAGEIGSGERFGWSVALSGNTALIGAPYADGAVAKSGAAYVFSRNEGGADSWGQVAKLSVTDGSSYDEFGSAVAIQGNVIAVGADRKRLSDERSAGATYVFTGSPNVEGYWNQVDTLLSPDASFSAPHFFGSALAINDSVLVVGAYGDLGAGLLSGAAYLYTVSANGYWNLIQKIQPADLTRLDYFGWSLSLDQETLLIGAPVEMSNGFAPRPGAAYVFKLPSPNAPPVANAGTDQFVSATSRCEALVDLDASGSSDPDGDLLQFLWSGVFGSLPGEHVQVTMPIGTHRIELLVTDGKGGMETDSININVFDTAPATLSSINAPTTPLQLGSLTSVSATFTDNCGPHSSVWDWGNATSSTGSVTESNGAGVVSGTHTYNSPGVYTVRLNLTDQSGNTSEIFSHYVVVYDPDGGFVTGGGWINSPAGAYAPNPSLIGKATFGFVSKYTKGANVPSGETQFNFKVANLDFHSSSYEWLVVAGKKAQYKGSGKINGAGDYDFMLTAIDGDVNGGGGIDKFRIRIWDRVHGGLIYDNQMNAPDSADPTTVIGGGSIVIHKE